ncbi:MAG: IS3 family transposase [Clostridia bacterium]|nr:IS3 family transposase [Clostridia bacterium]
MDNGIMENFFGRLKVEMYYGEKFECPRGFIEKLKNTQITTTMKEFQ